MKDYGNAGALCGAIGCMVLLFVSMHFAKEEKKPDTENVSAEIVTGDLNGSAVTTFSGDAVNTAGGEEMGDMSGISGTQTTETEEGPVISLENFIGPITLEQKLKFDEAIKYSPEVLHLVYPEELSIVGDSIASGFGVYDALNNSYDFATGNLAARSITEYNFSYDEANGTYIDALTAAQPAYIYLSMGMNDVNIITSDEYAEIYRGIITDVMQCCPESNIIVAGITPIASDSTFTANSSITMFNEKLKSVAEEFDSPNIVYFDAGSFIMDEETGYLREDCDGGDGIHLAYTAYEILLENLYPVLDTMPIPQKVKDIIDNENLAAMVITEAATEKHEEVYTETIAVEVDMDE